MYSDDLALYIPELLQLQTTTPSMSDITSDSAKVTFKTWQSSMGGTGPVSSYIVQYQQNIRNAQWMDGVTIAHIDDGNLEVVQTGLQYNTVYKFRVVPVYSDGSITMNGVASTESGLITTTGINYHVST